MHERPSVVMRSTVVVVTLLLASFAIQPAQAQEPLVKEFHFTAESGPTGSASINCLDEIGYSFSDDVQEEVNIYLSPTSSGFACATYWTYTVEEGFTTASGFDVALTIYCSLVGTYGSTPATSTSRFTIYHNGNGIGEVTNSGNFDACTLSRITDGATVGSAGLVVAPGDTIMLRYLYWGSDVGGDNMYIETGPNAQSLMSVLVEPPAAPSLIIEDLLEPAVEAVFENATTATYQYNFTQNETLGLVTFGLNATGNATALLLDGNGTELFNGTVNATSFEVRDAAPGNWTLTVDYENFTGMLSFAFEAGMLLAPDVGPPVEEPEGNTTVPPTEEEVLDAPPEDSQDAPGPALVLLLAGLVLAARRR